MTSQITIIPNNMTYFNAWPLMNYTLFTDGPALLYSYRRDYDVTDTDYTHISQCIYTVIGDFVGLRFDVEVQPSKRNPIRFLLLFRFISGYIVCLPVFVCLLACLLLTQPAVYPLTVLDTTWRTITDNLREKSYKKLLFVCQWEWRQLHHAHKHIIPPTRF